MEEQTPVNQSQKPGLYNIEIKQFLYEFLRSKPSPVYGKWYILKTVSNKKHYYLWPDGSWKKYAMHDELKVSKEERYSDHAYYDSYEKALATLNKYSKEQNHG